MLFLIYSSSTQKDTSNQMLYIHQYILKIVVLLCIIIILGSLLSFTRCTPPPLLLSLSFIIILLTDPPSFSLSSLYLFLVRIRRIIIHSHHSKLSTSYILFQPPTRLDYYIILYKILCCCSSRWAPLEFPFLSFLFSQFRLWAMRVEKRIKKKYLNFSRDDDNEMSMSMLPRDGGNDFSDLLATSARIIKKETVVMNRK